MSFTTRSQSKEKENKIENSEVNRFHTNRKRNRNPGFDLNRSSIHTEPKQRKVVKPSAKMANVEDSNSSQFRDLSRTIMSGMPVQASSNNHREVQSHTENTNLGDEVLTPDVRDLVADEVLVVQRSLEDKVREMVQEEMGEVRKSISDLATAVQALTRITTRNSATSAQLQNNNSEILNAATGSNRCNTSVNPCLPECPINRDHNVNVSDNYYLGTNYSANGPRKDNTSRPNSNNMNNDLFDFRQIRIDKLGIVFDNKSISIDDFIFRLEHLRSHYNISEREVVRDFHLLLSDSVKDWYWYDRMDST